MTIKKPERFNEDLAAHGETFTTYDIGVSAALLCEGFELIALDKANPKKALFMFKKELGIERVANKYFSDKLSVKARSFFDHLKAIKNKLYSD